MLNVGTCRFSHNFSPLKNYSASEKKNERKSYSFWCVFLSMIFNPTYLFVLIDCGFSAPAVALFHSDKAAECSRSGCHHEKLLAVRDKGQIHSKCCTLNVKVYAPIYFLCFNLEHSQIAGIIDGCN